jgi:hypothetical protein
MPEFARISQAVKPTNALQSHGFTPLHFAAQEQQPEMTWRK